MFQVHIDTGIPDRSPSAALLQGARLSAQSVPWPIHKARLFTLQSQSVHHPWDCIEYFLTPLPLQKTALHA